MKEKGQSLVELAISFVILMFLLGGLVEFGMIFFQFVQLRDAAQEGALYGSITPGATEEDIAFRARGASTSPINLATDPNLTVLVEYTDDNRLPQVCEGDGLKVTLQYPHKIFMPFIPQLLRTTHVNLSASVTDTLLVNPC